MRGCVHACACVLGYPTEVLCVCVRLSTGISLQGMFSLLRITSSRSVTSAWHEMLHRTTATERLLA